MIIVPLSTITCCRETPSSEKIDLEVLKRWDCDASSGMRPPMTLGISGTNRVDYGLWTFKFEVVTNENISLGTRIFHCRSPW